MSGGSRTQTTVQSNEPYEAAQPLLDRAMGDAMTRYRSGNLTPSSRMDTTVPWSSDTRSGMGVIGRNARDAISQSPFSDMLGNFGDTYGNGGFNQQQRTAMDALNPIARGDFLDPTRTNQHFESILSRTRENAGTDVSQMMAGMGRFAGGAHQGVLADTLGGIESEARLNQYNLERDRQTNAAGQLFGMGQTGMDNVANAGSVWTDLLAGRDAAPNSLIGLGSMHEDLAGRQLNDRLRRADAPLNDIRTLLGIASGAGGYGTSTAQTPTQNNTMSNMLGGGLGLASLLFGGGF